MLTVVNVCAWCDRELLKGNQPGRKVAKGCMPANASHGCCNECRIGVDTEIRAARSSRLLERAVNMHLRMKAIDLILSGAAQETE